MSHQPPVTFRSLIVIPARLASTRLPRKLLLDETGKPLIQHAYEAACRASLAAGVLVAADHEDIARAVRGFGGSVEMTDPQARSGTDRVAEIAARTPNYDILVNVQGDEPELEGPAIDRVIELLAENPDVPMATLATPIRDASRLFSPACVKVVMDARGRALYFSRSPIPHPREGHEEFLARAVPPFFQHIGVYAYRRDFLLQLTSLPPCDPEQVEKLEQLRVLHAGHAILVGIVEHAAQGIDTRAEYDAFVRRLAGA